MIIPTNYSKKSSYEDLFPIFSIMPLLVNWKIVKNEEHQNSNDVTKIIHLLLFTICKGRWRKNQTTIYRVTTKYPILIRDFQHHSHITVSVENRRFSKRLIAFHLLIWVVSTSRLLIDVDIKSKSDRCSQTLDWLEMESNCSFILIFSQSSFKKMKVYSSTPI